LKIYEDEPDESNAIDVPAVNEPTTAVLHQIRLKCSDGFQIQVEASGKKTRSLNCANYSKTGGTGFEIVFDSTVDEAKFYAWNKAVQEAEELSAKNQTLLDKLRLQIE